MCYKCDVAREVIRGNWGNGEERKRRLRKAGYDYGLIQNIVNVLLGYKKRHPLDYQYDDDDDDYETVCVIIKMRWRIRY